MALGSFAAHMRAKDYSGTHRTSFSSYEAVCTASRGSLVWDSRQSIESGETLEFFSENNFSIWSINAYAIAKFEGDLSFSATDVRETVTILPGSFMRIGD